jgi:hypothetical protein
MDIDLVDRRQQEKNITPRDCSRNVRKDLNNRLKKNDEYEDRDGFVLTGEGTDEMGRYSYGVGHNSSPRRNSYAEIVDGRRSPGNDDGESRW